jgi:hypothetical protein
VVCERLTATPRTLALGRRMTMRIRVVGDNGRGMARKRVTLRGVGVTATGRTNAAGILRITIRPRRIGILQIRVQGEAGCSTRLGVAGVIRPPLTG